MREALQAEPADYRLIGGAWVHRSARLPEDPRDIVIEPGAVIGADVEVGPGSWIGAGAVIYGPTRLGAGNKVFPTAVLGGPPQDLSYGGEPTRLEIGERNVFREAVTISRASTKASGVTRIGSDNLIMAGCHVGHDCVLEDRIILVNGVGLSGHCHVQSNVNISGGCLFAQFCTVGRFAFICGTSGLRKDVEPFISHDIKARSESLEPQPACINEVGLKRGGVAPETIQKLRTAYKVLFLKDKGEGLELSKARGEIEGRGALCAEVVELLEFIERKRASRFGRALGR